MLQPKWVLQLLTRQSNYSTETNSELSNQEFSFEGYEEYLSTQLASARDDFNVSINWAITSIGLILSVLLTSSTFPNIFSWYILLGSLIICTHFATRLARAYLNMLRWSIILQRITKLRLAIISEQIKKQPLDTEEILQEIYDAIDKYHINWISPISKTKLFVALLFEFGFFYFYSVILSLLTYVFIVITDYSITLLVSLLLTISIILFEIRVLIRGPYLKNIYFPSDMPWKKLI